MREEWDGNKEPRHEEEKTVPPSYRSAPSDQMSPTSLQRLPSYRTVAPNSGSSSGSGGRPPGRKLRKSSMWTVSEE
jgi:hypothetical protein